MSKETVNAIGLWVLRLGLVGSAVYAGLSGHDDGCVLLVIASIASFLDF